MGEDTKYLHMLNNAWIVPSLLKNLACMSPTVNKAWEEYVEFPKGYICA